MISVAFVAVVIVVVVVVVVVGALHPQEALIRPYMGS